MGGSGEEEKEKSKGGEEEKVSWRRKKRKRCGVNRKTEEEGETSSRNTRGRVRRTSGQTREGGRRRKRQGCQKGEEKKPAHSPAS